ncbi:MAG: HD domain-containing phosphohydrolase [Leptolyngbyaceae cyanobacterium]
MIGQHFCSDSAKLLIVDDYPPFRTMAIDLLSAEGYDVLEAGNGHQALACIPELQPDLILLDISMPGIDGFEVCRRLKQDDATRLIPIIFLTVLDDRRTRLQGIEVGGDDLLTKPFDPLELLARVKSLVRQKQLNEDLDHASQALFSIARAIESRDPNTGDHCERLSKLAQDFGRYLDLPAAQQRDLTWAGYLHDIGKVGIPDAILLKTGPLTLEEQAIMRQHVLIGEDICRPLRTLQGVLPIIRHHHERWDGSGYPDGLKGDEIPWLAQVFQVIDIYDALAHERPYKPPFSTTMVLDILQDEVNRGWRNPALVTKFKTFLKANHLSQTVGHSQSHQASATSHLN